MVDYDVLVIGAGSGGLAAAKKAAHLGTKVAIAESKFLGGTCVNRGCVPKKLMVNAADFANQQHVAASLQWTNLAGQLDWAGLQSAIDRRLQTLRESQQQTLQDAGVDILRGKAQFIDRHRVRVNEQEIEAHSIIIAVGSAPSVPDIPGKGLALTSREMFQLSTRPEYLAVVGGGYIGVEFSCIFARLGTKVTLIDTDKQVLEGFDSALRDAVQAGLERIGVSFIPETTCKEIEADGDRRVLSLTGNTTDTVTADVVLLAVGRSPNLADLKLEQAGVDVEDGKVVVDEYNRTSQSSIYAIGDCVGRLPLTPTAIAEGEAVAHTICQQPTTVDYRWIPSAVFGIPQAATVGWSEAEAQEQLGTDGVKVIHHEFTPLSHSLMEDPPKSLIKLVINSRTDQVVGVHIAGEHASEMLQGLVPALQQGLAQQSLASIISIHPTSAEELFSSAEG